MKDLIDIIADIKSICDDYPDMEARLQALRDAGYLDIEFKYLKQPRMIHYGNKDRLLSTALLKRKKVYRIQVGYTELQKGYKAAWCVDVSSVGVEYEPELFF